MKKHLLAVIWCFGLLLLIIENPSIYSIFGGFFCWFITCRWDDDGFIWFKGRDY